MPQRSYRFLSLLPAILLASPASAMTRRVPSDSPTIQAGIDAAAVGDTVLVAPGTYTGTGNYNIDLGGKDIVVMSEQGPELTVIDAQGSESLWRSGFEITAAVSNAARIDGFTIRGGYGQAAAYPRGGGGIWCGGASPTIANCIITENHTAGGTGLGGGILLIESGARIENCVVSRNEVTPGAGGGVAILGSPSVVISGCSIVDNDYGNAYVVYSSVQFEDCTIAGTWDQAAVALASSGSVSLERCIVWGNCPGIYGYQSTSSATLSCCVVDSSMNGGPGSIVYAGGNQFADPQFCSAVECAGRSASASDYRLMTSSPALPENNECGVLIGALESCDAETDVPPAIFPLEDAIWASPNPFTSSTSLSLRAGLDRDARLSVFDVAGRRVREFRMSPSRTTALWDGADANGQRVAAGTYLLLLNGRNDVTGRVTVLR